MGRRRSSRENLRALDRCDLMVAILDGPQVDGTLLEIGRFFHQEKRVLGIRNGYQECRGSEPSRINLMIEFSA
ncbi:MAG: nucleoside 2-deoxyribosyltransferase [Methanothrix sp.]|nr:nucleoside 2-deoxyribosyltransferase [Methanothrix sp.]MBK7387354.1 nucleoside 2-deoxyribosyltransferase [Methanothrix sp.]